MSTASQQKKKLEEEVLERTAPAGQVVYEAIQSEGEHELGRDSGALAWSGLAAGLSMGFSLVAQGLLRSHLPEAPWRPLLANLGYTVGFLMVILGRQQLFTENTLTPILPLLRKKSAALLWNVLRLWAVVLLSNLVGTMLFAAAVAHTEVFDAEVKDAFAEIGRAVMKGGFGLMMLRAVFAGWLIALMVWLLPAAESARVLIIIILSYLVGIAGFPHIIAGSVETFYLVASGGLSFGQYLGGFVLPTLLGNVLGGVPLVALLAHAQFMAEGRSTQR